MSPLTEQRTSWFAYRALRTDGAIEVGELEARDDEEVRSRLLVRGLFPEDVRVHADASAGRIRLSNAQLAAGLRLLGSLVSADLPLERALSLLMRIAPSGWSGGLSDGLLARAREGTPLATALADSLDAPPPFVLGLIGSGEANGALASGLLRAATELEAAEAARDQLRAALAYPALLAVTGSIAVGILVGVVMPRFAALLTDLGQSLPSSTRLTLALASSARSAVAPTLLLLLLGIVSYHRWIRADASARVRVHEYLLQMPVIGSLRFEMASARAAATLGALLSSGVPLPSAMTQAARAAGDDALAHRLDDARERVLSGESLARALELSTAATIGTVQLVRAGEATATVPTMLAHASRLDRERAHAALSAILRLVEPGLILCFGGGVALVAASLLQAVYAIRPVP